MCHDNLWGNSNSRVKNAQKHIFFKKRKKANPLVMLRLFYVEMCIPVIKASQLVKFACSHPFIALFYFHMTEF